MSKRQSDEARIIAYVESAPLASLEIVMGIANSKLKSRRANEGNGARGVPQTTKKKRGPNKKKAGAPSNAEIASAKTAVKAEVTGA